MALHPYDLYDVRSLLFQLDSEAGGTGVDFRTVEIGGDAAPTLLSADSPALQGLEPGEHELDISLRNADHSAAGADAKITVNVETAGSGSGNSDDSGDNGGGDDGY